MSEIKILSPEQINKEKWDLLVSESPDGSLYCTYDYLSLCEGGWEAILQESAEKYVCAVPVPYRTKIGMKFIYQSPFIPYLSILSILSENETAIFNKAFQKHLETFPYTAKFFLKESNKLHWAGHEKIPRQGLQINLQPDYTTLRKNYSKHREVRLKQTLKSEQQVILSSDVELFFSLHELYTVPRIGSLSQSQRTLMKNLWKKLIANHQAEIYFSLVNGETIAGTLIGKFGKTLYSLASTSTDDGRKLNGMTLLTDHIIKKYSHSEYKIFDLGMRAVDQIDDFKISFGAENYSFYQLYRNNLPWYVKIPKAILNFCGVGVG